MGHFKLRSERLAGCSSPHAPKGSRPHVALKCHLRPAACLRSVGGRLEGGACRSVTSRRQSKMMLAWCGLGGQRWVVEWRTLAGPGAAAWADRAWGRWGLIKHNSHGVVTVSIHEGGSFQAWERRPKRLIQKKQQLLTSTARCWGRTGQARARGPATGGGGDGKGKAPWPHRQRVNYGTKHASPGRQAGQGGGQAQPSRAGRRRPASSSPGRQGPLGGQQRLAGVTKARATSDTAQRTTTTTTTSRQHRPHRQHRQHRTHTPLPGRPPSSSRPPTDARRAEADWS